MKKYLLICILAFTIQYVNSQEIKNNESGSWYTIVNKFKVTEKFYLLNVLQWRLIDFADHTRIFLAMPSANYRFNNYISAGVGYTYVNYNFNGIRPPSLDYESRAWQHITLYNTLGKFKTGQRFMFEERFRTSNSGVKSYSNRFRYRFSLDFNLFKLNNGKPILGKIEEELRIRFGTGISDPKFDQSNFSALIGYPLLDNSKIYAGYGRDYYQSGNGTYWGDHLLHVMFCYDFDFSKKK